MPKARADGNYLVQVISTEVEAEATRLINTLRGDKFPASLERASLGDKGIRYRVVVGPYDDQLAAEKVAALLRERKFQTIVRLRR
jgi:cell division septation protein DedD